MTIRDRWRFILRYLFRYEPRAFRWIQVTKVISDEMKQKGCVPEDAGYEYTSPDGTIMVEHHVDDSTIFTAEMNKSTQHVFGGKKSQLFINGQLNLIGMMTLRKKFST